MFRTLLIALVMATLAVAGVLKLLDAAAFRDSLRSWDLIPIGLRTPAAVAIPALELAIGAAWLAGWRSRRLAVAALVLLAAFTAAYLVHWAALKAPSCDCFGQWFAFENDRRGSMMVVGRNGVLMTMLAAGLGRPRGRVGAVDPPGRRDACAVSVTACRGGFTILEVLIVVAIVAILVAQLSPALSSIRLSSRRSQGLALQRQHAAAFIAYTGDYRDFWPAFTVPTATYTVLRGDGAFVYAEYFDAMWTWPVPLAPILYDTTWRDRMFAYQQGPPYPTPYWYSGSFLASPEFWNPLTRTGPEQWRATRGAEVSLPAQKALLARVPTTIRDEPADGRAWFAFVDGSAAELAPGEHRSGYPSGAGGFPGSMALESPFPGLATIDGVRGRDR